MEFLLEIGVHIRKSVRTCYRSLLHHPVLTTFLVFLTFMHRFFPFTFSLLVTASPVLVCSVILLGTLLIFGQPDLTKIESEEKITHDFASVRTRVSLDANVSLERNERFFVDKFQRKGIDEVSCSKYSSDPEGSIGYMPLVDDTFHYTDSERRELDSRELENLRIIRKEKLGTGGITRDVKLIEKPTSLKGDNSESSHGGGGGDDEATSSGSDRAESTSPDASISDILPILDELHPLLDLDAPLPVHISPDDSGLESDRSNDGSNESDDEDTNIRSSGIQQYGPYDNDGDEEAHDGKEDESKSAIKWTEDDQMNLRDLGNLELEMNRCLEKVLTMRRASKIDEKNLIDLDTSENPINVAQISTTRQNPFDLSHDSYDDMGLPPIPGSAPSTYLPRKNPFDLPYEPNEENPELKGDHVEQECVTFLPTNTVFCRHQSFRPSRLGDANQERQDLEWRPVFVPEQLVSEGTSYSSFQGLPRDSSDSKLSSIPDTESASSGEEMDERKFSERVKEAEVISNIYQGSNLVNCRSHSSEDLDLLEMEGSVEKYIQHDESEIKLGEVENENASLSSTRGLIIPVEHVTTTFLRPEVFEDKNSNRSSSSVSSEVDDKSSDLRKDGSKYFEPFETEVQHMSGMVDDTHHKEPVYDTSPSGSAKVLSFSSISSYIQAEVSEVVTVPSTKMQSLSNSTQSVSSEDKTLVKEKSLLLSSMFKDQPSFDDRNTQPESQIILLDSKQDSGIKDVNVIGLQDPNMKNLLPMSAKSTSSEVIASRKKEHGAQETASTHTAIEQDSVGHELKASYSKDGSIGRGSNALDSTKEIASSNTETSIQETVSNVNVTTNDIVVNNTRSGVQESDKTPLKQVSESDQRQVSEGNLSELLKTSNSKDRLVEVAIGNAVDPKSVQETATAPMKKVSEVNHNEALKPSNLNGGSADAGTNAVSSTQSIHGTTTTLKQVSQGNVSELPKPSNLKDGSTELANVVDPTKSVQDTTTNQEEAETNVSTKSSSSKHGSTEVKTDALDSTKMLASSDTGSIVKEGITTHVAKQVSEGNLNELPRPSHANAESTEVVRNALGSTKNLQETVISQKQVSVGGIHELAKPSDSKDGSTKVPITINSTKSVQETITEQVSEGNVGEFPKPSKVESTEVDTNVVDPTKKLAPSNMGTRVQESTPAHIEGKVAEDGVGELPKPSNSTNEIPKVGVDAVGTTKDIPSSHTESDVQKSVTNSEADVVVPRPNSEGHAGEVLKPSISEESKTGELTKPKNPKESNAAEPQKPPESKGWLWW